MLREVTGGLKEPLFLISVGVYVLCRRCVIIRWQFEGTRESYASIFGWEEKYIYPEAATACRSPDDSSVTICRSLNKTNKYTRLYIVED